MVNRNLVANYRKGFKIAGENSHSLNLEGKPATELLPLIELFILKGRNRFGEKWLEFSRVMILVRIANIVTLYCRDNAEKIQHPI